MFTKSFALTGVSAALLSLSLSPMALAGDEKVETVYVSATRSEGPQMPVATQITVIDSEQIRLSGATTITEILRAQAGIQIQDLDGSGGRNVTVAMRGFASTAANNTLVLVDGRKLNNPTLASPALNTISLKDIERVEIIQGSAGVLYGDQAVGGVINVITRKAKQGEINGSLKAESGSNNLENYTASVNQGFASGLNYSFSAQKRNADNFRDNNQSASTNVLGNIGFDFSRGKVFAEQQRIDDNLRLPGPLSNSAALSDPEKTNSPNDFANQDTDITRVGGEVEFLAGWKLLGEFSDRDESGDYLYALYNSYSTYSMRAKNLTPRVVGNIATANGNVVTTLGYDQVDADYQSKQGFTDINQQVDGIYGQVIYPVTKKLVVSAGARHSKVDDTDNMTDISHDDSLNSTELGINYQFNSAWQVFARSADGFRFANADENAYRLPGSSFLDVQTSKSYEAGVSWSEKSASVRYSVYHMAIENEIAYDSIHYANINLPDSERQGFMFDGDLQLSEQISLRGNYTYTDAQLSAGAFDGNKVPFVAKDTANIGVVFYFVKNISAAFDTNYTGSRYRVGDIANAASRIDALTLFNFNILWEIKDVELGFRIKNITAEKYADYESVNGQYPQPGRTYNAHISYSF
ncbi:MAG TPA: TonB-dependent receptor [Cellvibrio sp.]|nr:TonB-dependent receptor [Cellvibrio sp.]